MSVLTFFDKSFDPQKALDGGYDDKTDIKAFDNIEEFEKDLVNNHPGIAKIIVKLDKPVKQKSKKQEARERLQRLEAICATQNRTLFEPKRSKKKKSVIPNPEPQCSGYFKRSEPISKDTPLVKLTIIED